MKQHFHTIRLSVLASVLTVALVLPGITHAEDKTWEIKAKDTLGVIVAKQYPGYGNRVAIMQAILKNNPDAFFGGNINHLIVGKTLNLPEVSSIPDLQPPAPVVTLPSTSGGEADKALQERLKKLEAERTEMAETLKLLEDENASLKEMVKGYEEAKQSKDAELAKLTARVKELEAAAAKAEQPPTTEAKTSETGTEAADSAALTELKNNVSTLQSENDTLKQQIDSTKQALDKNTVAANELKAQLDALKQENTALGNDLQQARAAASVAESKAASSSSSNWLPWLLLGLMALLMLPLLWLLKRNREEPHVTTVSATPKPVVTAPSVTPPPVKVTTAVTAVTTTSVANKEASYSDNTPLPPVTPSVDVVTAPVIDAVNALVDPENPEAELKLDMARAYLDLRESEAAAELLREVISEGGARQKQEANEILSFIL